MAGRSKTAAKAFYGCAATPAHRSTGIGLMKPRERFGRMDGSAPVIGLSVMLTASISFWGGLTTSSGFQGNGFTQWKCNSVLQNIDWYANARFSHLNCRITA